MVVRVSARLACAALGVAVLAGPAAAQATLAPSTTVVPGSREAGFGPTAYAEANRDFQAHVREMDAAQLKLVDAAERRASAKVQSFAREVHTAFSGGRPSFRGMSDDQGVPLAGKAALSREHETLALQLQAEGADVDRLFVDYEVLLLKEALGLAIPYALGGTDARWRQAAAEAVSAEQTLLAAARALQGP